MSEFATILSRLRRINNTHTSLMGNDWKLILTCNNLSVQNKKIKKGQIMDYLSRYVVEFFFYTLILRLSRHRESLAKLETEGVLVATPSRTVDGLHINSHDDRFHWRICVEISHS